MLDILNKNQIRSVSGGMVCFCLRPINSDRNRLSRSPLGSGVTAEQCRSHCCRSIIFKGWLLREGLGISVDIAEGKCPADDLVVNLDISKLSITKQNNTTNTVLKVDFIPVT